MLGALGGLLKSGKFWGTTGILGGLGSIYGLARFRGNSKSDEDANPQTGDQSQQPPSKPPRQSKSQTVAKQTASQSQKAQQTTEQDTSTVGAFLPELAKLYQLSGLLAMQYEQDAKAYYNIYQTYAEKLEKIIPVMTMMLAKTPLSQITAEDLPEKLFTMFKYYSWDFSANNFPKVLRGYYLIKANGGDTSNLTIADLIVASENPALAQGVNENFAKILGTIAEVYKLNMQSALDQIGKLKDVYAHKLNTLKAQADMIQDIIKAIVDEEKFRFEKWLKTFNALSQDWYRRANVGLKQETIEMKKQQQLAPLIRIEKKEGSKK
jgi:hypothetical protein